MTSLASLLLVCALIGLLGGAVAMMLTALTCRIPSATDSVADIEETHAQPSPAGGVTAHAGVLGAWLDRTRPGDAILIVAALGFCGLFLLVIVRAFAPWILLALAACAACWMLKMVASMLASRWPAQLSPMAPSGSDRAPFGSARFFLGVHDIDAANAALVEIDGHAGPIQYRPEGASATYLFSFERLGGNWRIYIDAQPSYRGRSNDLHSTHRLPSDGRYYICWTGALTTLANAIRVAARWADNTQVYIATGRNF